MEYADLAPLLAGVRAEIREKGITVKTDHWQACITDELVDLVLENRTDKARQQLLTALMDGTTCDCEDGVCKRWEEMKGLAAEQPVAR